MSALPDPAGNRKNVIVILASGARPAGGGEEENMETGYRIDPFDNVPDGGLPRERDTSPRCPVCGSPADSFYIFSPCFDAPTRAGRKRFEYAVGCENCVRTVDARSYRE